MFVNISNIIQEGLPKSVETWAEEKNLRLYFSIISTVT